MAALSPRPRDVTAFADAPKKEAKKEDKPAEEGGQSCFPANAKVYVKGKGPVCMSDLTHGDLLLCGDEQTGHLLFSPFIGYMHESAEATLTCVTVEAGSAEADPGLRVSEEHLVFAAAAQDAPLVAVHAKELRAGDWISRVSCDGDLRRVKISSVSKVSEQGLYAPLSQCGTVVVEGILCSCYTDSPHMPAWLRNMVSTHGIGHGALLPLRLASLLGLIDSKTKTMAEQPSDGIHPYCRALMNFQEVTMQPVLA